MKQFLLALLFLLPACASQPQLWHHGDAVESDIEAIHQLGQRLDHAWDQRDADAFSSLFLSDGSFRFPGGTLLEGREVIQNYYHDHAFPSFDADLIHVTTPQRIHMLSTNQAVADGLVHFIHTTETDPEKRVDLILFVTSVVVKRHGQWRIAVVRLIPVS